MLKKVFHITIMAVLALNLTGAMAFASLVDCGMECCKPEDWASTGIVSYEAPSCCDSDRTTCGFETAQAPEAFDKVVCCHLSTAKVSGDAIAPSPWGVTASPAQPSTPFSAFSTGPPPDTPLYLSKLSLIC